MRKTLLLALLFVSFTAVTQAQTNKARSWAEVTKQIVEDVAKTYSLTPDQASRVVSIKEATLKSLNNPAAFQKQTSKGMQTDYEAMEAVKAKGLKDIAAVINDEEKAKIISNYLNTRIPKAMILGLRPR